MMAIARLSTYATSLAINLTIIGSVVAIAVILVRIALRGSGPRVRYIVAGIGFVIAAVIPVVVTSRHQAGTAHGDASLPPASVIQSSRIFDAGVTKAAIHEDGAGAVLPGAWVAVAFILLALEIRGHGQIARRRKEWLPASQAFRETLDWPVSVPLFVARTDGPAAAGVIEPVVVLPDEWMAALDLVAARRVARHELDHARWRDPMLHTFVRCIRAILWISTPLWILARIVRLESEMAADAVAIATDQASAGDFAATLVDAAAFAASSRASSIVTLGTAAGLASRVGRLFEHRGIGALRLAPAVAVTAAAAVLIVAVPFPNHRRPSRVMTPSNGRGDEAAAAALNEILSTTEFTNHQLTPAVKHNIDRMRRAGSIAPLLAGLHSPDPRTRESVAWLAGVMRERQLARVLSSLLSDRNPHVRETARWAFKKIYADVLLQ